MDPTLLPALDAIYRALEVPMYYWITSGQDGTQVRPMSAEQLQTELDEIAYDEKPIFLTAIPRSDGACWTGVPEDAVVIIKGEIVCPTPVTTVTKYSIE